MVVTSRNKNAKTKAFFWLNLNIFQVSFVNVLIYHNLLCGGRNAAPADGSQGALLLFRPLGLLGLLLLLLAQL